ncbi:MAG: PTS sugar transporter subunit IIA [Burkholderiales bacterium]|nr:PTS sugar transporter subunit IIA [Burkholderiales bacterium]
MNTFARLCRVDDILLDTNVASRDQLFDHVGGHLQVRYGLDAQIARTRFGERERLGSTGLGQGVAVPHARLAELKEPIVLLVRPVLPFGFDAPDDKPVSVFFFLLVPEKANREHLQLLADAASLLCEQRVRDCLRSAASPRDAHDVLMRWSA